MIGPAKAMDQACTTVDFYAAQAKITYEELFKCDATNDKIAAAIFVSAYIQACAKDYETAMQAGIIAA